ncbi:hypothetical protein KUV80_08025 [Fictibacillus nanhaiensis]|uniref:hypothetical protein n=1 Tax=Fictibacillus nanhaiensis TaxID=742169 RepID=UPI001C981E40|nr:hypothetical protein [Fictibacillus nanhaiensis]MBY6036596.1 hypothetical protein [Fictibacillus nanhaiensis]
MRIADRITIRKYLHCEAVFVIHFYSVNHFPSILTESIALILVSILAYRIYKKQDEKPKIWKVLLLLVAGLFSFSIDWQVFGTFLKIPILPLGAWILYFWFRNKVEKWVAYRPFAWLGFFANFIFLAATLASIPIHHTLYPEKELSTYISKVEDPTVITLHPSASNVSLQKGVLKEQLHKMRPETIDSDGWYNQIVNIDIEPKERLEKFPYQLFGTIPKWGSGLRTLVYVERDGQGILLISPEKQFYFRSDQSLLVKGGGQE